MLGIAAFPVALQTGLVLGDALTLGRGGGGGGHIITAVFNAITTLGRGGGGGGHIITAPLE